MISVSESLNWIFSPLFMRGQQRCGHTEHKTNDGTFYTQLDAGDELFLFEFWKLNKHEEKLLENSLHNHQTLVLFTLSFLGQPKLSVQKHCSLKSVFFKSNLYNPKQCWYLVVSSHIGVNTVHLTQWGLLNDLVHQCSCYTFPDIFLSLAWK